MFYDVYNNLLNMEENVCVSVVGGGLMRHVMEVSNTKFSMILVP